LSRPLVIKALAVLAAGAFFCLLLLRQLAGEPRLHVLEGATMGTRWQVQLVLADGAAVPAIAADIERLLAHLDRVVFSTWAEDSELSRLNRSAPGIAHSASPDMLAVLSLALDIHARSRGAFDISVGALVNLWGFGPGLVDGVPDAAAIAGGKALAGIDALRVDQGLGTVTFAKPLALDLSGIAKGYAVDVVAGLLLARGIDNFLVEIGGELRLQGHAADGGSWRIAVERPEAGMREAYARIDSGGKALALAGSGDYRNVREIKDIRYSHEIDPRTGAPVAHALASVTVISDTAASADAWATALMVLGPDEGRAVADSEGLAAYFIMRAPDGFDDAYTAAFARYLQ
jgi:thiamine biosynthesis lipoprotein